MIMKLILTQTKLSCFGVAKIEMVNKYFVFYFDQQTGAGVQDNVPSSAAFISHNRFVYITISVLVLTLTVGILLPNSKQFT